MTNNAYDDDCVHNIRVHSIVALVRGEREYIRFAIDKVRYAFYAIHCSFLNNIIIIQCTYLIIITGNIKYKQSTTN